MKKTIDKVVKEDGEFIRRAILEKDPKVNPVMKSTYSDIGLGGCATSIIRKQNKFGFFGKYFGKRLVTVRISNLFGEPYNSVRLHDESYAEVVESAVKDIVEAGSTDYGEVILD